MRFFPPLAANFLLVLAAFGFGGLLRFLLPSASAKVDRIATILLGGLGLIGTLLFLIGMLKFSTAIILAVLLIGAAAGLFVLARELRSSAPPVALSQVPILPASVIALVLLVTFVGGLAEPVGDIRWDHISYHFLCPRVWLRDARIHPLLDEAHSSFPATVEVLYASVMSVGGTRAPEFFSFPSLAALLLVAFGLARRMGLDANGAWWAVALVAAMPVIHRGSFGGFNDAILAGFFLLALRGILDANTPRDYALAGIFAGLAMATKYTGIIVFLLAILCALVIKFAAQSPHERRRTLLPGLFLFATCAVLLASPWYIRNWLVLGSPIYPPPPALLHFFTPKFMPPQAIQSLAAHVHMEGEGMGRSLSSFLLLPFHFTYHPALFLNGVGGVGIDLLALVPFGIWARRRELFAKVLLLFVFLQTVVWFRTEQEARFLMHVYVILAVFAIYGWRYVCAKAPRGGPLLSSLAVASSVSYGLYMIATYRIDDLRAALSSNFERQRIAREVPFLDSFAYLNDDPQVSRILVLAPHFPTFYLRKSYLKPVGRYGEESIPDARDTAKLLQNLSAYGITHVIDVRSDDDAFQLHATPPNLALVLSRDDQHIYRVVVAPSSSPSQP
jgi:hypothetical protein